MPRWQGLAWVKYSYGAFVRFFGGPLGMPEPVEKLSTFSHMPVQDFDAEPIAYMTGLAAILAATALTAFRRRNL